MSTQVVEKKAVEDALKGLEVLLACGDLDALMGEKGPTPGSEGETAAFGAGGNAMAERIAELLASVRQGKPLPAGLGLVQQRAQVDELGRSLREGHREAA